MYPNLYFLLRDWFGVEWTGLRFINTFGLMMALSFIAAAMVLTHELKRKSKEGLLQYEEEKIVVGKAASPLDLLTTILLGFVFGYKIIGAFLSDPTLNMDKFIFSMEGNWPAGIAMALVFGFFKWRSIQKQKLDKPEERVIRVWPHDRVVDIVTLAAIFGLIGAKVFDNLENWDRFIQDPIANLIAPSGLTFYGGLICAAIAILIYARKKGIGLLYLIDAAAPALMIAYAIGRMGCQTAGDGDWGIFNSAYISDVPGHVVPATPEQFQEKLREHSTYFLNGTVTDAPGVSTMVTDRHEESLDKVPHKSFRGPKFLPTWMFAYTYPHNVNEDGILLPGCEGKYCRALPQPVFPTPFYEILACFILFAVLWLIRKRIKVAGVLFCIYLIMNGVERFLIETIRVNTTYSIFGIHPTQAELISAGLVITGIIGIIYFSRKKATVEEL